MTLPKRKVNRLAKYDYSQNGAYFVTICTKNKAYLLSRIVNVGDGFPVPKLNDAGIIVDNYISLISIKYPSVTVDKYVIMPNHFHLILLFDDKLNFIGGTGNPSPTLGTVIGWLKYQATKQFNEQNQTAGLPLFQCSFHDHIIRNENDYKTVWNYIDINPLKWEGDCFYSEL